MLIKKDLVAREEMSKEASRLLEYSRDMLHQVPSLFAQSPSMYEMIEREAKREFMLRVQFSGLIPIGRI
jgi:hypothetical protein